MDISSFSCIPIAFLLGSIPSAYIVAKLSAKVDIRDEPDGKISAAAVYRRVGLPAFITVVVMDIGKAALAVLIAQWLKAAPQWVMLAGALAVAGHQWSMFLRFQGGRGATAIAGVLVAVCTIPTLIGAAIAGVLAWRTKNSTYSFGVGMIMIAMILFTMQWSGVTAPPILIATPSLPPPLTAYHLLIAYPVILGLMMMLKALQVKYRPGANILTRVDEVNN
ncbi:MAG: glycerol-3-phosphate acyltransferase [Chloroflexi bacterium]|nr:glycerol-3-phosphate acyltransferase [Chloroflexota bacterium]